MRAEGKQGGWPVVMESLAQLNVRFGGHRSYFIKFFHKLALEPFK